MNPFEFPFDKFNFGSDSVLEGLSIEDNRVLNRNMTTHGYKKGEILFREGSYPTGIYFVQKGKVKKYTTDNSGREQIIYIYQSGELLGYHALISQEYFRDSAAVIEDSTISFIPKEDFLLALNSSSVLSNRLLKCLSHEFGVLAHTISIFANRTVRERLALSLLILRDKYKTDAVKGIPVELNLTRDDLAKLVGTARETLVRLLKEFKEEGLIKINGRKIILIKAKELSKIANLY
ncbi:MAG: Crp/Fnr family transcriptional regulator [Bacteroidia bacterium]